MAGKISKIIKCLIIEYSIAFIQVPAVIVYKLYNDLYQKQINS